MTWLGPVLLLLAMAGFLTRFVWRGGDFFQGLCLVLCGVGLVPLAAGLAILTPEVLGSMGWPTRPILHWHSPEPILNILCGIMVAVFGLTALMLGFVLRLVLRSMR